MGTHVPFQHSCKYGGHNLQTILSILSCPFKSEEKSYGLFIVKTNVHATFFGNMETNNTASAHIHSNANKNHMVPYYKDLSALMCHCYFFVNMVFGSKCNGVERARS